MNTFTCRSMRRPSSAQQRGVAAITWMLMMIGLVAILGLVEVGYVFWVKRDTQKIADLAALAGAQQLDQCTDSNDDNAAARTNATTSNGFTGTLKITCGYWDSTDEAANGTTAVDHFYDATAENTANAVKVVATRSAVPFFHMALSEDLAITASAVATYKEPIASFSIGSSLLELDTNSSILAPLLNGVLGTSLGLKLLSTDGVAGASVNLLDILEGILPATIDLKAATVDEVLDTDVSVGDLLDATVTALQNNENNDLANIDLSAIQTQVAAIKAVLGDVTIKLGDILDVVANTTSAENALGVDVGVSDLVSVALQAANSENAVSTNANINLGALATVGLKVAVVEPAKIGIGGPGATAHTAQTRIKLNLKILNATNSSTGTILKLSVLGLANITLSAPAGQTLSLPINLELTPGTGTIESIQCYKGPSPLHHEVDISAAGGVANVFVGNLDDAYTNTSSSWSQLIANAISNSTAYANLLSLNLHVDLLFGLVTVADTTIALNAYINTPINGESIAKTLYFDPIDPDTPVLDQELYGDVSSNYSVLSQISSALLTSSNISIDKNVIQNLTILGINANLLAGIVNALLGSVSTLVTWLLGILGTVLSPVLTLLDQIVLGPLLTLLDINIGNAQVHLLDVQCTHGVRLVY